MKNSTEVKKTHTNYVECMYTCVQYTYSIWLNHYAEK